MCDFASPAFSFLGGIFILFHWTTIARKTGSRETPSLRFATLGLPHQPRSKGYAARCPYSENHPGFPRSEAGDGFHTRHSDPDRCPNDCRSRLSGDIAKRRCGINGSTFETFASSRLPVRRSAILANHKPKRSFAPGKLAASRSILSAISKPRRVFTRHHVG